MSFRTSPHHIAYCVRSDASLVILEFACDVKVTQRDISDDFAAIFVACVIDEDIIRLDV